VREAQTISFLKGWPPFGHESIEHEPLTALEQWKVSRHLWLMVVQLIRVQTSPSLWEIGIHVRGWLF